MEQQNDFREALNYMKSKDYPIKDINERYINTKNDKCNGR